LWGRLTTTDRLHKIFYTPYTADKNFKKANKIEAVRVSPWHHKKQGLEAFCRKSFSIFVC
jgi:hypothetical protein